MPGTNVTFTYATPSGSNDYLWSQVSNLPLVSPINNDNVIVTTPGTPGLVTQDDESINIRQLQVASGAEVDILAGITLSVVTNAQGVAPGNAGLVALQGAGSDFILGNSVGISNGLNLSFGAGNEKVTFTNATSGTDSGSVSNFGVGDAFDFQKFTTISSVVQTGSTLTVTGTPQIGPTKTYTFSNFATAAGVTLTTASDGAGGTYLEAGATCYAAGTRLRTPTGERAVEDLREGDLILTQQGDTLVPTPITWVGQLRVDLARHPRPEAAAPIRIRRGAFADGVPHRDLLVSPEHCLFADGQLIAAKSLVNGATIVHDFSVPAVQYFHIETTPHAIVLAEGLPAETYLDTGNRAMFDNAGQALLLHPEFHINTALRGWDTDACAPLATTAEQIAPVWHRLAARAQSLGHTLPQAETTTDAAPRLRLAGRDLAPVAASADRLTFLLPAGTTEVALVSRHGAPTDITPWCNDHRRLGLAVTAIALRGPAGEQRIALDAPAFGPGWHKLEQADGSAWRWTDGRGVLRLPETTGRTVLELRLGSAMTYRLDPPARERHAA